MQKIFKRWVCLLAAAAMLLGATACSLIEYDEEKDRGRTIAEVGNLKITKGELLDFYNYNKAYMGITEDMENDPQYADNIKQAKEEILGYIITQKVVEVKAGEAGYLNYTDEQRNEAAQEIDTMLENIRASELKKFEEQAKTDNTIDPQAKADESIAAMLAEVGQTRDKMVEDQLLYGALQRFEEDMSKDAVPSETDVKNAYDERALAKQQSYLSNPSAFENDVNYDELIVYRPAGYRYVKHILIKLPDAETEEGYEFQKTRTEANALLKEVTTLTNEAQSLQSQSDQKQLEGTAEKDEAKATELMKEADQMKADSIAKLEEAAKKQQEADLLSKKADEQREETLNLIREKSQDVLNKATAAGADFDKLIEEFGEDPGMTYEPNKTNGYLMSEKTGFMKEFLDAGLALSKVGDISGLVATDYGFHIIKYESDVTEGQVPFEEVKEALTEELTATLQQERAAQLRTQWEGEVKIKKYLDRL